MVELRSLTLALRGIWWRRWSSAAVWVVAVACAGIAAAGPSFAVDARDAVLQATLRQSAGDARGTGITTSLALERSLSRDVLDRRTAQAFAPLRRAGFVGPPVVAQEGEKAIFDRTGSARVTLPMVYRQDSCAHMVMRAGTCVDDGEPLGVDVTAETARSRHWRVGTSVVVATTASQVPIRVKGIYEPAHPREAYWFAASHRYFGQVGVFQRSQVPRTDAVIVPAKFWRKVPPVVGDDVSATVDLALVRDRVHTDDVDRFETLIDRAVNRVQTAVLGAELAQIGVQTRVAELVRRSDVATQAVALPILIVAAQLLILTWLVLYLVLVSSAESRSGEIVLGKLRGLAPRETVLHALLEPLLLIVSAVPVGVLLCDAVLRRAGPTVLGRHADLTLPAAAWWAGAGAALGGVVATGLASAAVLRRSVVEQWRRTERRPRRGGWAVDAVVVALAVTGFVELASTSSAQRTTPFLPAVAPGLLAVACALLGVRLVPMLARTGFRPTRASGRVALFVAVRQLARRPADLRVFVLLTVAVALLVFGAASRSVYDRNRHDRALTEVGTARVVSIGAPARVDPSTVVARLDPAGHWASAVYDGPLAVDRPPALFHEIATTTSPSVLVVDPASFAAVAFWRSDFGPARLARLLQPLRAAPPAAVPVVGTSLRVTALVTVSANLPVQLRVGLTTRAGRPVDAVLGTVAPTRRRAPPQLVHLSAALPACAAGCEFRRFSVRQNTYDLSVLSASVDVTAVDAVSASGPTSLLAALRATTWTNVEKNDGGRPAETVRTDGASLAISFTPAYSSASDHGYAVLSQVPASVPALVTSTLFSRAMPHRVRAVTDQDGAVTLTANPVAVLPRAGDAGAVLPRSWIPAARPDGYERYRPNEVWLGAGAPADFPARLAAAGLTVRGVESAGGRARALGNQGPSFAVAMLVFGAGAAGALAVAGASTSLFIASRRRLYEMAAMRSLGVRPSRLLGSLVLEQAAVGAAAALVGLAAGLVGARVALHRLPEFADVPQFPAALVNLPLLLCALLVTAVVGLSAAIAALGGAGLVRQASPSRLREAQA